MQKMIIVSYTLFLMLVAGCSGQKVRENMYQGIYEGSRIENQRGNTPADNMPPVRTVSTRLTPSALASFFESAS